jgi:protocatechuate 4,5-dioxygenase beta chain
MFPEVAERLGSRSSITRNFATLREKLEAARPDLLVIFTSDHFVGFFYDNMPTFCIGAFDEATGPVELSRTMPTYTVKGAPAFAKAMIAHGIENKFDLSWSEDLRVDHSVFVPLHFLTPAMNIPIVTVNIRGHQTPLPRADRCFELGEMIADFVTGCPDDLRVGFLASGNLSLEVGGPRMGTIDKEWWSFVVESVESGDFDRLIRSATPERILAAGNTAGEVLNWIALAGAMRGAKTTLVIPDAQPPEAPRDAHAYAVWEQ